LNIETLNTKDYIIIQGARLHNLKHISVAIPRNKLVVITGLSGSGKSSLAFDTLYAEGQRRYVESLSSYARQFLGRLNKPKVDSIKGISPAIAIEQKVNATNPRSTVGTSTEIYDYLKLLYTRIGRTYSPISGNEVKKDSLTDILDFIKSFPEGEKLLLLAPIHLEEGRTIENKLQALSQQGYSRIKQNGNVIRIDDYKDNAESTLLVVDRVITKNDEDFYNRLADAIEIAFFEGNGELYIEILSNNKSREFNNRFEADGTTFLEPNVHLFSFNNPYGACPTCEGYGDVIGIDHDLVVPNTALSVYENAIFSWRGESMSWYRDQLVNAAYKFDFPIHKPWFELTEKQKQLVWDGNEHFEGLSEFFTYLESKSYKIQNRVMLSRYRGKTKCSTCKGKRLRPEASFVKINNTSIIDLVELPLDKVVSFFESLTLDKYEQKIA
jgi:excinuclease ABC subunit A